MAGPGVVYSFTVNWNPWQPGMDVPFGLALVEFPTAPGFRLLGRVSGADVDDLRVGRAVTVGFEDGPGGTARSLFRPSRRPPVSWDDRPERQVVLSGLGQSAVGRQLGRSGLQLTLDAITAAVADAGLRSPTSTGSPPIPARS